MFRANKKLGQHFLKNKRTLLTMVNAAAINHDDTVLEVGPGFGSLTDFLTQRAKLVIAIEKDKELYKLLKQNYNSSNNKRFRLVWGDALKTNFGALGLKDKKYKVVANIPYYITSSLIEKFLSQRPRPTSITLLIQKEVAQRIVSAPPHMNILALSVAFFATAHIVSYVPKELFSPKPDVDSAVIHFSLNNVSRSTSLEKNFFKFVKAGFAQKRKTLANSLSASLKLPKETILSLLEKTQIPHNARAQEISLDTWIKLAVAGTQFAL